MSAKHLNLSTVVDKNKIATDKVFLILLEVGVLDSTGALVDTLRFCKNSENITFNGNEYVASNFTLNIKTEVDQEPQISLSAEDKTRALGQYVEAYDGLIKSTVKMIVVNSGALSGPPELEEDFLVIDASISNYTVNINLGVESAVAQRFPAFRQFKDRCMWKYKGTRCGYVGAIATCDYTRNGANGCVAHGNEINFGAFPGIVELM